MKITTRKIHNNGHPRWVLDYSPNGKRIRRCFKSKLEADAAARDLRLMQKRAGEDWMALSSSERADLMTTYHQIRSRGLTLGQVWQEWCAHANTKSNVDSITLIEAGRRWLQHQREKECSPKHLKNCTSFIERFVRGRLSKSAASIQAQEVRAWLDQYENPVSWNTHRNLAKAWFSYLFESDLIPHNPLDKQTALPKRRERYCRPVVFSPEQVRKSLLYIWEQDRDLLAYFTLATFAGVRPEECDRMTWEMIDLDRGLIDLPEWVTKTRRPRLVHLEPAALQWLRLAKEQGSRLPWHPSLRCHRLKGLRTYLGFKEWPHDIMRHTFGSYYVELHQSLEKASLEMGNSPEIIQRHYRELVRPEECRLFWALTPQSVLHEILQSTASSNRVMFEEIGL